MLHNNKYLSFQHENFLPETDFFMTVRGCRVLCRIGSGKLFFTQGPVWYMKTPAKDINKPTPQAGL